MALIKCSDCGSDVSSNAPFCQKCGNPIGQSNQVKSVGTPVYTTEATSKKLKLHYLYALGLIVVGFLIGEDEPQAAGIMIAVGIVWLIATKVRIWWHHK